MNTHTNHHATSHHNYTSLSSGTTLCINRLAHTTVVLLFQNSKSTVRAVAFGKCSFESSTQNKIVAHVAAKSA